MTRNSMAVVVVAALGFLWACGGKHLSLHRLNLAAQPATGVGTLAAGLVFTVPEGWQKRAPSSSMRLAEYGLPGSGGEAELTVFSFGRGEGGDAAANVNRWIGQFTAPGGGAAEHATRKMEADGLSVTIVEATGTYTPTAMGPMAPRSEPRPDQRLFGLIVEGGPA
ncbi:hypothetical protein HS125_19065 [bacterium]|nr:hypothetical protein [bacterium]